MGKDINSGQHKKNEDREEVNWVVVGPILAVILGLIIAMFIM